MSDTFKQTRDSFRRLKTQWRVADEDARYRLAFWAIGLALMAGAIITQFGWPGFVFCLGVFVFAASDSKP
jgi:hypothetical protein